MEVLECCGVKKIAAMNLLLDIPPAQREEQIRQLKAEVGECSTAGPVGLRTGCGASST